MKYEELPDLKKTALSGQILYLGARGSILSKWQANYIAKKLEQSCPGLRVETKIQNTEGDRVCEIPLPEIGGKGVFTFEIEKALLENKIDIAVHSFKDLPVENNPGLNIAAICERADPRDALISRHNYQLHNLPKGASVGTSSTRRAAQLLFLRPDLNVIHIRGNVDTRIKKVFDFNLHYDAIVLAYAGLMRIGLAHVGSEIISIEKMLPAPAQGALAIQCKENSPLIPLIRSINHVETMLATTAERSFLKALGGGCSLPVAAFAEYLGGAFKLVGAIYARDGSAKIELEEWISIETADLENAILKTAELGNQLAELALSKGADKLLKSI
jgi:hydroxymethylbilane synthase